jgi:uncharacterized repeat protein (TIGR03803 family)
MIEVLHPPTIAALFSSIGSPVQHRQRRQTSGTLACAAIALLLVFAVIPMRLHAQSFSVIHTFAGGSGDGSIPTGTLIRDSAGNLYGTTQFGGTCPESGYGCGTAFKMTANGTLVWLYPFAGGATDGALPYAGLTLDSSGKYFYGSTINGGNGTSTVCNTFLFSGCGTIFKLDAATGKEVWVYSLQPVTDGANPFAGVVLDPTGATVYGATNVGSANGYGAVIALDAATGTSVSLLHSFPASAADGAHPSGLAIDSQGAIYGTTYDGGDTACANLPYITGCGTAFRMNASGTEVWLHAFGPSLTDPINPTAGPTLSADGTTLYGTTTSGGSSQFGAVFQIDTATGTNEAVLHSFAGNPDGQYPQGGVAIDNHGKLYGTTQYGGSSSALGTVFKVDPSLPAATNEAVLHSFSNGADGAGPLAAPTVDSAGNVYGVASYGGLLPGNLSGQGTLFKITSTVPFAAFHVQLEITAGPPPGFQLRATLTQGTNAPAINPLTQGLTLSLGSYTLNLPSTVFQKTSKSTWVYDGKVNGVSLQVRIAQQTANSYLVQVEASGVNLTTLTNPISVTLTLGANSATTQVNAGS